MESVAKIENTKTSTKGSNQESSTHKNPPGNPRWKKGVSGNPAGRPSGARDLWPELYEALRTVEEKKKKLFAVRLVELSWNNPHCAVALAKKFWPDLTQDTNPRPSIVNIVYGYSIVKTTRIPGAPQPEIVDPAARQGINLKVPDA